MKPTEQEIREKERRDKDIKIGKLMQRLTNEAAIWRGKFHDVKHENNVLRKRLKRMEGKVMYVGIAPEEFFPQFTHLHTMNGQRICVSTDILEGDATLCYLREKGKDITLCLAGQVLDKAQKLLEDRLQGKPYIKRKEKPMAKPKAVAPAPSPKKKAEAPKKGGKSKKK